MAIVWRGDSGALAVVAVDEGNRRDIDAASHEPFLGLHPVTLYHIAS